MRDLLLMMVLVLVGAIVGIWYGPSLVIKTAAASDWDQVGAKIESVEVVRESSGSGTSHEVDYQLHLRYRYEVAGQEYVGTRYQIARDLEASTESAAEELAAELRASPEIQIFVDPNDPSAAIMDQGGALYAWMTTMFGWLMFVWGCSIYLTRVRPHRGLEPGPNS